MKQIPATSLDRYVTGFDALNIPAPDGRCADWHFLAAFVDSGGKARVVGDDYPDTSHVFGRYGIRECGRELRAAGHVGTEGEVWAADFVRAILDLVYRSAVVEGVRPDHVPATDLLDASEDLAELTGKLAELKGKVSDRARFLIEEWEAGQLSQIGPEAICGQAALEYHANRLPHPHGKARSSPFQRQEIGRESHLQRQPSPCCGDSFYKTEDEAG